MLKAYIRWLNAKRHTPYRNTPLLGNPCEIVGHAPPPRRPNPTFSRAQFGKYEQRQKKLRLLKWFIAICVLGILAWIAWESVEALSLFQK